MLGLKYMPKGGLQVFFCFAQITVCIYSYIYVHMYYSCVLYRALWTLMTGDRTAWMNAHTVTIFAGVKRRNPQAAKPDLSNSIWAAVLFKAKSKCNGFLTIAIFYNEEWNCVKVIVWHEYIPFYNARLQMYVWIYLFIYIKSKVLQYPYFNMCADKKKYRSRQYRFTLKF
jgi:hypothetical protein